MNEPLTNRCLLRQKAETLTESEIEEVLDYIQIMQSMTPTADRLNLVDEVMVTLWREWTRSLTKAERQASRH
jgi:hypothetical protein